jgi:serine/threonine protein kinase
VVAAILSDADYGKTPNVVEVGQVIDAKYKVLRLLGDGGMGSVYEAEHLGLGTRVAVKVLHADLARRAGLIERFLQEARVSAQIKSPHVVRVMDVDRTPEGVAYLVMDLLQGEPLSNVIRRDQPLSVGTATEYTKQILQALEAAHALGVVHRDLKPDNVFVTFEGGKPVLKLIDFGIAKLKRPEGEAGKNLTVAGMLMGTPEYMAPEQAYSAAEVDVRADLYSVGAILYEMLSGRTPVSGEDPRVVVLKVERGEVTPLVQLVPGILPELAGFVHRAMAPRPELRFANATEMRIALEDIGSGKRTNTAKLPQAAPPQAALPQDGGSTVMGAPAPGALTPPVASGSNRPPAADVLAQAPKGGTVRAAPIDVAPAAVTPPFDAPSTAPPRRSGMGLVIGLAVLALMLGAGAVVAWVSMNPQATPTPEPVVTTTETTATTPSTTPSVTTTTALPGTLTTTPPLTQPPVVPQPQPQRPPAPKPSATPAPSGSFDPAHPIPPIVLPSGFPSALPTIPSVFPSSIPGLPSGFPQFPFPPPPQPQPSPAKSM